MCREIEGQVYYGVTLKTHTDDISSGISRPRVKPIDSFDESVRVEFPRNLRELFPIGTEFKATVKVCQKHNKDGRARGAPYLKAYDVSVIVSSVSNEGLIAKVKAGSVSGLAYEYKYKTKTD